MNANHVKKRNWFFSFFKLLFFIFFLFNFRYCLYGNHSRYQTYRNGKTWSLQQVCVDLKIQKAKLKSPSMIRVGDGWMADSQSTIIHQQRFVLKHSHFIHHLSLIHIFSRDNHYTNNIFRDTVKRRRVISQCS